MFKKPKVNTEAKLLAEYRAKISSCETWRGNEGLEALWKRMIDLYRGNHYYVAGQGYLLAPNEDRAIVNICKATIDTMLPGLALNDPKAVLDASTSEDEDSATINEALLNYQWRRHDYTAETTSALLDSLIMGIGFVKCSWLFVEEPRRKSDADIANERDFLREQVDQAEAEGLEDLPDDDQIEANMEVEGLVVVADHPTVDRVSPFDLLLDHTARRMKDVRWVCQKVYVDIEELRGDKRYDQRVVDGITPGLNPTNSNRPGLKTLKAEEDTQVCLFEFYDLRQGTMCVFAEQGDGFLVKPEQQPYESVGEFTSLAMGPFVPMVDFIIPEILYPMGELEPIESLQQELNVTRSQLMNHRRKYARQYLYDPAVLSVQAIRDLKSNVDNIMVPIEGGDLANAIIPIQQVQVPAELYQAAEQILNDAMLVSGRSEYQMGAQSDTRHTATESSIINEVMNSRAEAKRKAYETFLKTIAGKVCRLNQQFIDTDQVVRIVGQDGAQGWVDVSPEDLVGQFDFSIEVGSTQPLNEASRRRQAADMAQATAPFIEMGIADPVQVFKFLVQNGYGIKDPSKFLAQAGPIPGQPPVPGDPSAPEGPPEETPMEAASQGVSPQLAQLEGQVGLDLGRESPDGTF